MDRIKDTLILEEELEYLREKLNKYVGKNILHTSKEYRKLLYISRKLDNVIVNYIKSSNK
jgi:hypothetical protein